MVKARKYVVIKRFNGNPQRSDFEIVTYDLPPLLDNQILVKVEWISVDPYMRPYANHYDLPYDQFGYQVGIVQESKNTQYPVGSRVVSHYGWCDYCIMNPDLVIRSHMYGVPHCIAYALPEELEGLSASLGIGAVGFAGAAAYFGLLKICKPKMGQTVVVTTAAGAVGSIAGQIAKIHKCTVIGFTGRDDKVQWLTEELGFDYAFNYKTVDVDRALKEAAPHGVDCYFDNVGGELSIAIMHHMNQYGRIAISGCISTQTQSPTKTFQPNVIQPTILVKQLKVEGFLAFRWIILWPEAFTKLANWIKSGKLKVKEHVTVGFDNIVDALVGMLSGQNCGKAVVKFFHASSERLYYITGLLPDMSHSTCQK